MPSWGHLLVWSPPLRKIERLRRTVCWLSPVLWARCWQREVANYFVVVTYFIVIYWFQWQLACQNWLYQKFHIRCFVTDTMTKIHLFKWWKTCLLLCVNMTHPQVRIDTISHNLLLGKQVVTKTRVTANVSHNRLHWKNGIPHTSQTETRKETSLVTTEADVQDANPTKESSVATEAVIPGENEKRMCFVECRQGTTKIKRANAPKRKMRARLQKEKAKNKMPHPLLKF